MPSASPRDGRAILRDAMVRARKLGDRGVRVTKDGSTIVAAEPHPDVQAGTIEFVLAQDVKGARH